MRVFFMSDVPLMSWIQKTSPDPVKFGPDPEALEGLKRTPDTKNMNTKRRGSKYLEF